SPLNCAPFVVEVVHCISCRPVAGSQSRVVPPQEQETRSPPCGWKDKCVTFCTWPTRVANLRFVWTSQIWMLGSLPATARRSASGCQATTMSVPGPTGSSAIRRLSVAARQRQIGREQVEQRRAQTIDVTAHIGFGGILGLLRCH